MRMRDVWLSAALVVAAAAGCTSAVEVRLMVADDAGTVRKGGVVTSGVPFARGAVKDVARLSVSVGGKHIPAQFIETAPWDDGSARWALMDTQVDVPADGTAELVVRNGSPAAPTLAKRCLWHASRGRLGHIFDGLRTIFQAPCAAASPLPAFARNWYEVRT